MFKRFAAGRVYVLLNCLNLKVKVNFSISFSWLIWPNEKLRVEKSSLYLLCEYEKWFENESVASFFSNERRIPNGLKINIPFHRVPVQWTLPWTLVQKYCWSTCVSEIMRLKSAEQLKRLLLVLPYANPN
jgi:hypothetical protein